MSKNTTPLENEIKELIRAAELIVYPHTDDLGFGFISMNPARRHEQKEWLQTRFCDFQSSNVKTCPN